MDFLMKSTTAIFIIIFMVNAIDAETNCKILCSTIPGDYYVVDAIDCVCHNREERSLYPKIGPFPISQSFLTRSRECTKACKCQNYQFGVYYHDIVAAHANFNTKLENKNKFFKIKPLKHEEFCYCYNTYDDYDKERDTIHYDINYARIIGIKEACIDHCKERQEDDIRINYYEELLPYNYIMHNGGECFCFKKSEGFPILYIPINFTQASKTEADLSELFDIEIFNPYLYCENYCAEEYKKLANTWDGTFDPTCAGCRCYEIFYNLDTYHHFWCYPFTLIEQTLAELCTESCFLAGKTKHYGVYYVYEGEGQCACFKESDDKKRKMCNKISKIPLYYPGLTPRQRELQCIKQCEAIHPERIARSYGVGLCDCHEKPSKEGIEILPRVNTFPEGYIKHPLKAIHYK